ncbi:MAG: hypothetical protein DWP98_00265 [Bacteroidetes bacterium]|nr:MAG: hypothetical protein DWP98_00265 [Bacteroidota bacterium]MBL1145322.1 hypothetical protein [Bacteroidota bacterium]
MFKTRKNKSFNFIPRHYNQDKEEFESRYAQIEAEMTGNSNFKKGSFRPNLKAKWQSNKKTSSFSSKSNVRLIIIALLLFFICYYILFN